MKPKATLRSFFAGSSLLAAASVLINLTSANAAEYWWNQDGTTAGWGGGGTWDNASAVFSTTNSDTASAAAAATTTSDTLNFGTSTVGFAGGTITGNGATRNIGTIVTGSANNTADINLTNIRLSFADPGTITNNSSRALAISGIIIGTATRLDLNANGGDIQLTGSGSTYSGTTYINAGTVWSNNADCLGASGSDSNRTVIASGARLLFNNSRTYTERFEIAGAGVGGTTGALYNSNNRATTLSGQVTLSGNATTCSDSASNALTFGGGIVLGTNALTFNSVNTGSIQTVQSNAISGTGSVVKAGSGVLNLNVASSYTGGTTLNAGTINIGAAISGSNSAIGSTSGALTVNGGTLNMAGNNVTVGNLTGTGGLISGTTGTRTLTIGQGDGSGGNFQGAIQNGSGGTTALIKTGLGTITLSGANTYTGGTTVTQGALVTTQASSLAEYNVATKVIFNGGTIGVRVGGAGWTTGQVDTLLTNATKTSGALGIDTTNANLTQWAAFTTTDLGANLGLNKLGTNTLTLDLANNYAGATTISTGSLQLGNGSTTGSLTGTSGITNDANLTINRSNAFTQATDLNNKVITGTGSFTQAGSGTTTLSLTNTYTGATTVSAGTLLINGSTSTSSVVTVGTSGTLGGSGTVGGATLVHGNLNPGNSPGVLSFTNSLALGANSSTTMEINGTTRGSQYDGVNVGTTLGLDGDMVFDLGTILLADATFDLFAVTGSTSGAFDNVFLQGNMGTGSFVFDDSDVWSLFDGNNTWTFTQSTGDLSLVVIPEPSAALLGGFGLLALLRRRR